MASLLEIRTDKGILDLQQGTDREFYVTRQIHDLHSFETRNADFSKSIKVPPTPNNLAILETYTGSSLILNSRIPCSVLLDGITISAKAELLFIKTNISNAEVNYEVQIFYGNFNLFDALKEGTIDSMNWADLSYNIDDTTSLANIWSQNTTDRVNPLCDWVNRESLPIHETSGASPTLYFEANIMGFFIYAKEIIKRMIEEAGYTVVYAANLPSDFFQIALAAPVSQRYQIIDTDQLSFTNAVSKNGDQSISNGTAKVIGWDVNNNSSGWWVPADNWWLVGETGDLKVTVEGWFTHVETGIRPASEIRIIQNLAIIATFSIDSPQPAGTPFFLTTETVGIQGDQLSVEIFSAATQTTITIENATAFRISTPGADTSNNIQPSEWIPQLGKSDFLANILKLFNLVLRTDDISRVVTIQPFDDVYTGAEQNLSINLNAGQQDIERVNSIDSLAQNSWFKWQEDNLLRRDVNHVELFENQLLAKEKDVITMEFSACDNTTLHFDPATDTFLKAKIPAAAVLTELTTPGPTVYPNVTVDAGGVFSIDDSGGSLPDWQVGSYLGMFTGNAGINNFYRVIEKTDDVSGVLQTPLVDNLPGQAFLRVVRNVTADEPEPRLAIIRSDGGEASYFIAAGSKGNSAPYQAGSLTANWMDSLKMSEVVNTHYKNILNSLQTPQVYKAWFTIPTAVFVELDLMRPVYIEDFAAFYYINKIEQFKVRSLVRLELVRL